MDLIIFGRSRGENDFRIFVRSFRWFLRFFIRSKFFQILVRGDAINLVQKSSKSELSSRFLSRSKFWGAKKVEFSKGRLPPEDGSVRLQTLGKRVPDDPQHFIFQRRKKQILEQKLSKNNVVMIFFVFLKS